jgi:hypothetical protein
VDAAPADADAGRAATRIYSRQCTSRDDLVTSPLATTVAHKPCDARVDETWLDASRVSATVMGKCYMLRSRKK